MSYTSPYFLLFTAACLAVYGIAPKKMRWCVLLTASMGFYAMICLKYIGFMILTAASTYGGGILLERYITSSDGYIKSQKGKWSREEKSAYKEKVTRNKKLICAAVLVLNFGILAFLKYYGFFITGYI